MKSFAMFIQDLNDGATLSGLTSDLGELIQTVQSTGRSGSLTLKIKVAPATKGQHDVDKITVTADRKLELPKPEAPQDFFWLTDNAEPTRKHPRQQEIEFREVPKNTTAVSFSEPDADGEIKPTMKAAQQ